jgi:hypothetical protein
MNSIKIENPKKKSIEILEIVNSISHIKSQLKTLTQSGGG